MQENIVNNAKTFALLSNYLE